MDARTFVTPTVDAQAPVTPTVEAQTPVIIDAALDASIGNAAPKAGFCGSPPFGSSTIAGPDTIACCKNYLREAADASTRSDVASRPETGTCCSAILSYCSPTSKYDCLFFDVVSFICCPLLNNPNVPFCGPWGPPTPPAMPRSHVVGMA